MQVSIAYHAVVTHITLTLGGFFCQDVTFKSFLVGDLTGAGNFEALLGATVCFNLWHYITILSYSLLAFPIPRETC
jgi:hypothetical protein